MKKKLGLALAVSLLFATSITVYAATPASQNNKQKIECFVDDCFVDENSDGVCDNQGIYKNACKRKNQSSRCGGRGLRRCSQN